MFGVAASHAAPTRSKKVKSVHLPALKDTQSKDELFSKFESAHIKQAIQETCAQPLPDDIEDVQDLLKEADESENTSLLASSRAAGVVLGRSTVGPQQNIMNPV